MFSLSILINGFFLFLLIVHMVNLSLFFYLLMLMDFFHSFCRFYTAAHSWVFFLSKLFFFQFDFYCLFTVRLEMLVFFVCFIPLNGFVSPLFTFP